mmetsp:Transcript_10950/g.22820  ORF Transcript_10950/g.22820 Transcript_10950/m.22820 type:complete len:309 (-) Transcript_10950:286-1212(-)
MARLSCLGCKSTLPSTRVTAAVPHSTMTASVLELPSRYTGFPVLGIEWQKMESPSLRASLGMQVGAKGVLICRVEPLTSAFHMLKRADILLSFNGVNVANNGTVPFRSGERISFTYLVSQKYTGETATLEVLSEGAVKRVNIQLQAPQKLVPVHIEGRSPSYLVVGGLVFNAVSVPYLRSEYGKDYDYDSPVKILDKLMYGQASETMRELVVLSQVLAADVNVGYEDIVNTQVLAFNGNPISTLRDLACLIKRNTHKYLRFDLEHSQMVVLEAEEVAAASSQILATHCIPHAMSEDLRNDEACLGGGR